MALIVYNMQVINVNNTKTLYCAYHIISSSFLLPSYHNVFNFKECLTLNPSVCLYKFTGGEELGSIPSQELQEGLR